MELSNSKTKKLLILLIINFSKRPPALFSLSSKNKKNPPSKKFLIFQELDFFSCIIKKIQETVTPQKNPYISGNGNPKKLLIFQEMEPFSPNPPKIEKIHPKKISYIFSKENFPYIFSKNPSEMDTPKESLCFRKRNFLILQELTFQDQNFLYFFL